jgi:hypothetical protein
MWYHKIARLFGSIQPHYEEPEMKRKEMKRNKNIRRKARGQKMKCFAGIPSKKPPITVKSEKQKPLDTSS